jgi:sucrose-phosphate synthase
MPKRLLVTDLDGTLLGDDASLEELLRTLEQPDAPAVAFATGRQGFSAMPLLEHSAAAVGQYLIAGVGAEMYRRLGKRWLPIAQWPNLRAPWEPDRVRSVLAKLGTLRPQTLRAESVYKISFVAPLDAAREVRETLRAAQIDAVVIHSHGDLLDVLPAGIDKGSATRWLGARIGVSMFDTMTCGNTANDLGMLRLPCASVVVGNADAQLLHEAPSLPSTHSAAAPYAAGILEGLRHFGWLNETGWIV